ncbi:hypothetical protein AAG570_003871 [Ranatra chinensis]|uniref:Sodium-coupled monocarboxylate transporter 1 n=1 Tax=Ranatra chinensis TaxID=642074 RepID=A0ABD0Y262_9HEMI
MAEFLGVIDYLVFGSMLVVSALVGVYFAFLAPNKQDNTQEYLMGGKTMGVFPISMSLIASYISGISLLGIPAEMYVYGTQYWVVIFSEALVSVTMAFVYIPVFYTLQITSSYEYLNLRFDKSVRTLGCFLFLIKMMLYIPMVVYVPALAFSQVTGINLHMITPIVCSVCIFYTTLGGLKAVVWTDAIQMFAMLAGMASIIIIGLKDMGLATVIQRNMETHRIEFDVFDPDPRVRHTVWGVTIGNYFYWLAACSVNQAMVQRCLAMPTRAKANLTILNLAIGIVILVSMCCFTGLILYAHFHGCDPILTKKIGKADQLLPYYVMAVGESIPGLPGMFVSGVFSAALSTMSTGMNSMTGVIFEDLLKPFFKKPLSEATSSFIMKIIVVIIGAICVGMVFVVEKLGALIQAGKSLSGITTGPLLGLFSLGMFVPWANSKGAMVGGICAVCVTGWMSVMSQVAIAQGEITYPKKAVSTEACPGPLPLNQTLHILAQDDYMPHVQVSYLWYSIIGTGTVLLVGTIVSYLTGFNDPRDVNKDLLTPVIHRFLPEKEKVNMSE